MAAPGRVEGVYNSFDFLCPRLLAAQLATAGQQKKKRASDVGEMEIRAPSLDAVCGDRDRWLSCELLRKAKKDPAARARPAGLVTEGGRRPRVIDDRTAPLVSQTRLMTTGTMTVWLTSETSYRPIEAADDRQRFLAGHANCLNISE